MHKKSERLNPVDFLAQKEKMSRDHQSHQKITEKLLSWISQDNISTLRQNIILKRGWVPVFDTFHVIMTAGGH